MDRVWRLAREHGFDALVVIAAFASALGVALSDEPDATPWFAVPAIALVALPLLGRRRFPFAAPALVWIVAAALSVVDGRVLPVAAGATVAGFAAAFLLGNLRDATQARLGLAIVLGGAAIVVYNDPSHDPADLLFTPLLFGIGWLAGFAMRERSEQAVAAEVRAARAEREREAAARVAVAEERARIARELHDIVAHAVSVMVLQVGAVRHKLADDLPEAEALDGVERTGRTALAEMRRLLGAMRSDDDDLALAPQSGLGNLAALSEQVGQAGLPVSLHIDGEPHPLPHGLDVSAYRIVQEGLTNALKHGHATEADVTVRYGSDELYIEVRDDGIGAVQDGDPGYGLIGIRERVKIYGGEMTADTASDGGFVLRARLPLRELVNPHARARRARGHPTDPRGRPRRAGPDPDDILDEYIYEALSAGASGFVLKDEPPERLIAAIRTVAAGDALLSPTVTKRVIGEFARFTRPDPPEGFDELTPRERDILRLVADGLSNAEIGQELYISETTVKTHVTHVLQKLDLRDRVQAVVLAHQSRLFEEEG